MIPKVPNSGITGQILPAVTNDFLFQSLMAGIINILSKTKNHFQQ